MGFFTNFLRSALGATVVQTEACHDEIRQIVHEFTARQASSSAQHANYRSADDSSSVSSSIHSGTQHATFSQRRSEPVNVTQPPATSTQPAFIKEPDDLGTPNLPLPDEVPWLDDSRKTRIALEILERDDWGMSCDWNKYYVERKAVEEIVSKQEQRCYDYFWQRLRDCWKMLQHPFWKAYLAGHFPDPQVVKGIPALVKEICVLDVKELKYRQAQSLIEDDVYTLGMLQSSLFSDRWQPTGINDMDKWYFRKVLMQYGLEVPPSDEPEPIPFAELFIGTVFGVKVTPQKRLSSYDFIQGDESLEDRVRRVQEEGLVPECAMKDCEDVLFYQYPESYGCDTGWALRDARRSLKARKILAGGNYPEVRSAMVEGVDLDQLEKILVKDLSLSSRAQRGIREYFVSRSVVTVADLVRTYHDWLVYEDSVASIEIKEYLYQHDYVIRPEDMPMDERTHIAYLKLPTRVRMQLRYPGRVETVDDLVRCCSGNDPVFSLRYTEGIGKKSMEAIRARLVELGFLTDSQ